MVTTAIGAVAAVGVLLMSDPGEATRAILEPSAQGVFARHGEASSVQVLETTSLGIGDAVRTDATGRAVITYADGTTLVLEPQAELVIAAARRDADTLALLRQTVARLWFQLSRGLSAAARYEGRQGGLAAVVRAGSSVEVQVAPDGTTLVIPVSGAVTALPNGTDVAPVTHVDPAAASAPGAVAGPSGPNATNGTSKLLPGPPKPGSTVAGPDWREPKAPREVLVVTPVIGPFAPAPGLVTQPTATSGGSGAVSKDVPTGSNGETTAPSGSASSGAASKPGADPASGATTAKSSAGDTTSETATTKPADTTSGGTTAKSSDPTSGATTAKSTAGDTTSETATTKPADTTSGGTRASDPTSGAATAKSGDTTSSEKSGHATMTSDTKAHSTSKDSAEATSSGSAKAKR